MSTESNPASPDEEFLALLARVRQSDEAAASELVRRYERAVLRSVRSRLGHNMRGALDSVDVLQSVHRSLLIGLKNERFQVSSPQQLIGLAVVMVQRKVARQWRKLKRRPTMPPGELLRGDDLSIDRIAGDDPTPSQVASAAELLERSLAQLDELDQQLVRLKLNGLSSVEAGAVLGRDAAFVRMRWTRLRQKLRDRGLNETG
jgi:RNA polymerase sigma-70 factor (ECF subfamily)